MVLEKGKLWSFHQEEDDFNTPIFEKRRLKDLLTLLSSL